MFDDWPSSTENPKGILPQSPALWREAGRYAGKTARKYFQPQRGCGLTCDLQPQLNTASLEPSSRRRKSARITPSSRRRVVCPTPRHQLVALPFECHQSAVPPIRSPAFH